MNNLPRGLNPPPRIDTSINLDQKRKHAHWDPFLDSYLTDVASRVSPVFIPSFDIRETPNEYLFMADLPGISLENLDIQLEGSRLTVAGERAVERLGESEVVYAAERTLGTFSRSFHLPDHINNEEVTATLDNGVLTIQVPKRHQDIHRQGRSIAVKKGSVQRGPDVVGPHEPPPDPAS